MRINCYGATNTGSYRIFKWKPSSRNTIGTCYETLYLEWSQLQTVRLSPYHPSSPEVRTDKLFERIGYRNVDTLPVYRDICRGYNSYKRECFVRGILNKEYVSHNTETDFSSLHGLLSHTNPADRV